MFTSNIDLEETHRRIAAFREKAENGTLRGNIIPELSGIFGDYFSFTTETRYFLKDRLFYRARPIQNDDTAIPLKTINSISDAWEAPPAVVKTRGRLNDVGESVLYCCAGDPHLAIEEARATQNNRVAIMVYKARRQFHVSTIGRHKSSGLPKDARTTLFYDFLEEEFAHVAADGKEDRYIISKALAELFFQRPTEEAWCYRSVKSPEKCNVAFFPGKQRDCLCLQGILICDLRQSTKNALCTKFVVDFHPVTGEARYHLIGSPAQKHIFPELS